MLRPEGLGCFHIDGQLEPGRLHDRKVRWLLALENSPCIDASRPIPVGRVRSVAHEAAYGDEIAHVAAAAKSARRTFADLGAGLKRAEYGRGRDKLFQERQSLRDTVVVRAVELAIPSLTLVRCRPRLKRVTARQQKQRQPN